MSCKTCAAVRKALLARMARLQRKRPMLRSNKPPAPNPTYPKQSAPERSS